MTDDTAPHRHRETAAAEPAGYLHSPTLAGETLVFVCEDDLWTVDAGGGRAVRVTAGGRQAASPRLSPDGRSIAFSSRADGPPEIYVVPLAGGAPRRLTYQGAQCAVAGWLPGGEVLYASAADQPKGFGTRLFAVPATGGVPRLLPFGQAAALALGPGGGMVLGRNTGDPARRKRYRGGTAGELWIDAHGTPARPGGFRPLIRLDGNTAAPCWVGDRIWFLSDHGGTGDVHSCRPDGTDLRRHTGQHDFYARNMSTDGRRLVFQAGADLFLLDPEAGPGVPARRVPVRLAGGRARHLPRYVPAGDYLDAVAPDADGGRLAVVTRGQVFVCGTWRGPAVRTGHGADPDLPEGPGAAGPTGGVRHRLIGWLPESGDLVAALVDDGPAERLAVLPAAGGPPRPLPLPDLGRTVDLEVSPTHDRIALANHRHELHVVDIPPEGGEPQARLVDRSEYGRIADLSWSADGSWLAYTFPASVRTSAIRVAAAGGGPYRQVTEPVLRDYSPSFDPEGRCLYFISQREFTPSPDELAFGLHFARGARPYALTLRADEPSPFAEPLPAGAVAAQDEAVARAEEEPEDGPVRIDFAGIARRMIRFPVPEGRYDRVVAGPGSALLLRREAEVTEPRGEGPVTVELFDLRRQGVERLASGVDALWPAADRRSAVVQCGDLLGAVPLEPAPAPDREAEREPEWIDLARLRVRLAPGAEWRQMFREAWQLQREQFWAGDMAGVDWDAVYDRYLPLVDRVSTRWELSDLLWEAQGELATSHAYEFGGDHQAPPDTAQGFLGVDWQPPDPGRDPAEWRIAHVVAGDVWDPAAGSPLARPGVAVAPGDAVVAVDGCPVGPAGPGELLADLGGREVELTVRGPGGAHRRYTVRTLTDEGPARYREWVTARRDRAHALSGGRVGYLHIPDMYPAGYAEFVRGFLQEVDREALLVDVRFNGGGYVSPLILDKLARRRLGRERPRWGAVVGYPQEAPRGPMVALVNEHTGSDGDLFAHVFRRTGLGPLVGSRTWGGIIAAWPRHTLVDGTLTTQPEFSFEFDDIGQGLENTGVEPDIDVRVTPDDARRGRDPQLDRAVAEALALLTAARPEPARASGPRGTGAPAAGRPAPRDRTRHGGPDRTAARVPDRTPGRDLEPGPGRDLEPGLGRDLGPGPGRVPGAVPAPSRSLPS